MNLLQEIKAIQRFRSQPSQLKANSPFVWPDFRDGRPEWQVIDYDAYVNEGFNLNSLVYSAIMYKVRALVQVPLIAYTGDIDRREQLPIDHPLQQLVFRPNPHQSFPEFQALCMTYWNLSGNNYIMMARPKEGGLPESMYSLRPDRVFIVPGKDKGISGIKGFLYVPEGRSKWLKSGQSERSRMLREDEVTLILPEDMMHTKLPNPGDPLEGLGYGLSPLSPGARTVDIDNKVTHFLKLFFDGGTMFQGLLSFEAKITPGVLQQIKERWKEQYGGYQNWDDIGVLDQGASFQRISPTFDEMGFKDIDERNETRSIMVWGVPPILIGSRSGLATASYCLPKTANISTPNGLKRISEIRKGDYVYSLANGDLIERMVTWQGIVGHKQLYEIKTKNRTLKATGNHPVLVYRKGKMCGPQDERSGGLEWKSVDELHIGDWVVQHKALPSQNKNILPNGESVTKEYLQYLGAIIGDGTVDDTGRCNMAMPPTDRCFEHYVSLAKSLFKCKINKGTIYITKCLICGRKIKIIPSRLENGRGKFCSKECANNGRKKFKDCNAVVIDVQKTGLKQVKITESQRAFSFSSKAESQKLIELGFGGRAHTKRIPGWIYTLTRELRLAFLAGIVDSDGYIDSRGCLTVGMCNKRLIEDIRELLISCGIQCCNIRMQEYHKDKLMKSTLKCWKKDVYYNYGFTASNAVMIAEIPFSDSMYRKRVNSNTHRHKTDGKRTQADKVGLSENLGFYAIKSIEKLDERPVYDITVEDSHCFIADGIVVHNSNYKNAREACWDDTLVPETRWWEADYQYFLHDDDAFVAYDYSAVPALKEKVQSLVESWVSLVQNGVPKNVAGDLLGLPLPQLSDGDVVYMPLNMVPVGGSRPSVPSPIPEEDDDVMEAETDDRMDDTDKSKKKGLSQEAKYNTWKRVDSIAESWEKAFNRVGKEQFEIDLENLLAIMRDNTKEKKGVDWQTIGKGWEWYLSNAGERWREAFVPAIQGVIEDQGETWNLQFGQEFDIHNLFAEKWFDDYLSTFAQPILDTTNRDISALYKQAQIEGLSIPAMDKRLHLLFKTWTADRLTDTEREQYGDWFTQRMTPHRLEMISRTTTMQSSNLGTLHLGEAWSIPMAKEWLATFDNRVRPDHQAAGLTYVDDGAIPLDEKFVVGGVNMDAPLDPSAPPEQVVFCRCALNLVPLIDKPYETQEEGAAWARNGILDEEREASSQIQRLNTEAEDVYVAEADMFDEIFRIQELRDNFTGPTNSQQYREWENRIRELSEQAESMHAEASRKNQEANSLKESLAETLREKFIYVNKGELDIQVSFRGTLDADSKARVLDTQNSFQRMINWNRFGLRTEQVEIALGTDRSSYTFDVNIIDLRLNVGQSTIVHEFGHWFEDNAYNVYGLASDFLRERTAGDKLRWLGRGYDKDEKAWFDKFINPYMGKKYDDATEIVSMGMEMMFSDPGRLASEDPDYFDFMYNLLRGL